MKFSYSWLQSFFDQKLPAPKVLAKLLTQKAFETEAIGRKVLEVDVLPNRAPDCLSYQGLAREIGAILGLKAKSLDFQILSRKTLAKTSEVIKVDVKVPQNCQRYSVRLIEGVKVQDSPAWLKQRLEESGLRPINNVVDLANYVMLETGQPIHVFDLSKIEGAKLIIRPAKPREKIITLDGKVYSLDQSTLVVADARQALVIAGVKGGRKAEISSTTTNILVEAANFSRASVRNVWKKMGLRTEASWRFENGLDLNLVLLAQNRFASLMNNLYQAKPAADIIDICSKTNPKKRIEIAWDFFEKLLGVKIEKKKIITSLESLGFKVSQSSSKKLRVVVPSWRLDIFGPADLVEEVARLYGYENIPAQPSLVNLIPPVKNWARFWKREIRNILIKLGFTEVLSYSFISEDQRLFFYYPAERIVEVANPVSARQRYLRPNLLINLLKSLKENEKHHRQIKFFEIGKVFTRLGKRYQEQSSLGGVLTFSNSQKGFYELKGIIKHLATSLVINDLWFDNYQASPEDFSQFMWHPTRVAEIKVGDEEIGFLGEIHPRLEEELNLPERVLAFEINLEKLTKLASEDQEYRPVSCYPAAKRDLSVVVPQSAKVGEVIAKINEAGGLLVRDVDLVSLYQGKSIPAGKKSITLRIYFQATDHSLKTQEINGLQTKIINSLHQQGWKIRI